LSLLQDLLESLIVLVNIFLQLTSPSAYGGAGEPSGCGLLWTVWGSIVSGVFCVGVETPGRGLKHRDESIILVFPAILWELVWGIQVSKICNVCDEGWIVVDGLYEKIVSSRTTWRESRIFLLWGWEHLYLSYAVL